MRAVVIEVVILTEIFLSIFEYVCILTSPLSAAYVYGLLQYFIHATCTSRVSTGVLIWHADEDKEYSIVVFVKIWTNSHNSFWFPLTILNLL